MSNVNTTRMMDELPKNAKNAPGKKKGAGGFLLKLKPTAEGTSYRFRLLSFTTSTSTRDYPFIEKLIHEKWEKDAEGKGVYRGFVTCPVTKYVKNTLPPKSNPYDMCPICKYTNSNFIAYKESNYKDKISGKVLREHKRKYIALVPVYVVKDPNDATNINKARVWVIKDKELYDKLNALIKKQQSKTKVFNTGPAVDLLVFVKKEKIVVNEGKPTEFSYNETKIDKFGFGKQEHAIEAINNDFIDAFPFDEDFYTFSTPEELQRYYEDNVISNSNIPEDGIDADELEEASSDSKKTNTSTDKDEMVEEDINVETTPGDIVDKDLSDIDTLLDEVTYESDKPTAPKLTETIKPASSDLDDIDGVIDDILGTDSK